MAGRVISAILTLKDRDFSSNMKKASNGVSDFDRKLQQSKNQISAYKQSALTSFSNIATGVAGLAAAYVGFQTASNVFSTGINAASSMEGYRNTLNVVMKDTEKAAKTMAWAVDFANKTPFETDSVVEATVRLQSYGLEAQKVLPTIGDMAGVMGKDVMQAVEAVADAQTGELERLKEFGITKAMIEKKAGEMYKNQTIINNKGQIVEQEKFNNALMGLMQDRFKGGMDIQANSFKGVMSTISGVWKTGLATMMGISATGEIVQGGLFDTIKDKAMGLSGYLTKMSNDGTFTSMGNKISSGIEKASKWFGVLKDNAVSMYVSVKPGLIWIKDTGLPALGDGIGFVADKAAGLYTFFKDNWSAIGPVVYGVAGAITFFKTATLVASAATTVWKGVTGAMTLAQGLLNGAIAISPLGWVAIAIGAVIAGGVLLYKNWDTVKAKALELWDGLKSAWSGIEDGFLNMWTGVKSTTKGAINFMIGGLNDFIGGLNSALSFEVPEWVPGIGGKGFEVNIPKIPKFALGTSYFKGGLAQINERGGEIVDLPNGSRIYPHDKSVEMARNDNRISIGQIIIHAKGVTAEEVINEVVPKLELALANM